jgi:hypothetical protein
MKAILEFNLPEDQEYFDMGRVKYEEMPADKWETCDEIYQEFFRLLEQNNIKL